MALVALARSALSVARRRRWSTVDERMRAWLVRVADLQFVLGLLLYLVLSPIVRSALADPKAAMKSAVLRFFAVEHITSMVIALAALHIGEKRVRRATDDRMRQRRMLSTTALFCLCIAIGIPWPSRPYGRPLARTQLATSSELQATPELYGRRCAVCHGAGGRGDGVAAGTMQPRPRDLTDRSWQASVSDAQLREVIVGGGLARDMSANMPPHPDLSEQQLDTLVRHLRALRRAHQPASADPP